MVPLTHHQPSYPSSPTPPAANPILSSYPLIPLLHLKFDSTYKPLSIPVPHPPHLFHTSATLLSPPALPNSALLLPAETWYTEVPSHTSIHPSHTSVHPSHTSVHPQYLIHIISPTHPQATLSPGRASRKHYSPALYIPGLDYSISLTQKYYNS